MRTSEFDPAIGKRRPWNIGRMLARSARSSCSRFGPSRFWLDRERRLRGTLVSRSRPEAVAIA